MSWREQEDAMFIIYTWAGSLVVVSIIPGGDGAQWRGEEMMMAKAFAPCGKMHRPGQPVTYPPAPGPT